MQNVGYYTEGAIYRPLGQPTTVKRLYGSMPLPQEPGSGAITKDGLVHLSLHPDGRRRARIDFCQILVNVLVPVAIFAVTCAVLSFKLHYNLVFLAWVLALCCALPAVFIGWLSRQAFREKENVQGKWMMFLCILCILAWLLAVVIGNINYSTNLLRFYEMSGLNYYTSVDPSASGQSHIDAGRMMFQPGSRLDIDKAMGVKISNTYCVAPVVAPHNGTTEYDYWAVGRDCCSSIQPQARWNCGDVNNHHASAGMRLMAEADRPFYRMAVQEAEATYKLNAKHPIFIHWMEDPAGEMTSWREAGQRLYVESVSSVFVLMFFLSFSAGLYFSRASSESIPCQGTGFHKYVGENADQVQDFIGEDDWEDTSSTKSLTV